jgi:tetratricopeptide (TPR) repeat protein
MDAMTPRFRDPNTEAYYVVWSITRKCAQEELDRETKEIVSRVENSVGVEWGRSAQTLYLTLTADASVGMPTLDRETAYRWLTEMVIETEMAIERRASKRTSDIWLLQSRRDLACSLWQKQVRDEETTFELGIRAKLAKAIALFAAPGNTSLPNEGGPYEIPVSKDLAIDIHVLSGLCRLHENCLIQRRRLLIGGTVTLSVEPFPVVELSARVRARLSIFTKRLSGNGDVFSRIGFHVPHLDPTAEELPDDAMWRLFCVAARAMPVPNAETASELRPYALVWYDALRFLEVLQFFAPAIEAQWGMHPLEIVSAALVTCMYWRNRILDPETAIQMRYVAETRAVFSIEEQELLDFLSAGLPIVSAKLGKEIDGSRVPSVIRLFFEHSNQRSVSTSSERNIRLVGPIPFLFRAADKFLIDLSMILMAFSSIVNWLDLSRLPLQKKGKMFEDQVRNFLLAREPGIKAVPEMERKFIDEAGMEVGEADVVVQVKDTAFLIECKSYRYRGTDDCLSFAEASRRTRGIPTWVNQVRATAKYLAEHPKGRKHQVPSHVRWIVPVICSTATEVIFQDNPAMFIVEDELPITMTPPEILAFIQSGRWESDRNRVTQYPVASADSLCERGRNLLEQGRLEEATQILLKATELDPKFALAFRWLGTTLVHSNRARDGTEAYRKALALDPTDVDTLNNLGIALFKEQQYDDAIGLYRAALRMAPDDGTILVHLANALDARGDADIAIDTYFQALALDRGNAQAWYNLAVTLEKQDRVDEAIDAYRNAVASRPAYANAWNNLGSLLQRRGKHSKSIDAYRRAVEADPSHESARINLAKALSEAGQDAEAAYVLGTIFQENGEFPAAIKLFMEAVELDPGSAMAFHHLGRSLAAVGDRERALRAFEIATALQPDFFGALRDLGIVLREIGKRELAAEALRKAQTHLPDSPDARRSLAAEFNNLGSDFSASGFHHEAIELLREAIATHQSYPLGYFNLGRAHTRKGEVDEAIAAYRRAIDLRPGYAEAWSNLGAVLAQKGLLDEAAYACHRALAFAPDDLVTETNLAMIYHREGAYGEAEPLYRRSLDRMENQFGLEHPDLVPILERYAELFKALNRPAEAERLEERARRIREGS